MEDKTNNYIKHQFIIQDLSVTQIKRAVEYIQELKAHIPMDTEANKELVVDLEYVIKPFVSILLKMVTNKRCSHCNEFLYLSDLSEYDYVCYNCEENFYEFESA